MQPGEDTAWLSWLKSECVYWNWENTSWPYSSSTLGQWSQDNSSFFLSHCWHFPCRLKPLVLLRCYIFSWQSRTSRWACYVTQSVNMSWCLMEALLTAPVAQEKMSVLSCVSKCKEEPWKMMNNTQVWGKVKR